MPVYLHATNDFSGLAKFKSVLIVPCRFCPAASLAVSRRAPYFDFFPNFLKTPAYEQYLGSVESTLVNMGIKTRTFKSYLPHQFVTCMWTRRRRAKLRQVARNYEAVLVMGCEAALNTVQDAIDSAASRVFQGMRTEGIMSIKPLFHLPCSVSLELNRITPLLHKRNNDDAWERL
jgi:hypothetical protein